MRIVALEEHIMLPEMVGRIAPGVIAERGFPPAEVPWGQASKLGPLKEIGEPRLADMDAAGIAVQVLSVSGPGAELLADEAGIALARDYNDWLAQAVAERPHRYRAFAHLPMLTPGAAASELERAVTELGFAGALINGTTDGRFLDHPEFDPILAKAEELDVPIYIHPGLPPAPVRAAYYEDLPGQLGFILSIAGWGWHVETALHVLRLVLSGALERHPRLKLVIGHMGEALPFMLARCEQTLGAEAPKFLRRSITETILDQVWITTSGFFSLPPFMAALMTFGADRILFSVDYPYASNREARAFLDQLPVSPADREKIAHRNADALLKLRG